jgi:hypothetical protein
MYHQFQNVPNVDTLALLVSFGLCFVVLFPLYWWWKRSRVQTSELVDQGSFESTELSDSTQAVAPVIQIDECCEDAIEPNVEEPVELQKSQKSTAEFTHSSGDNEQEKQNVVHVDKHMNAQHLDEACVLSNDASISVLDVQGDERNEDDKQGVTQEPVELQEEIIELTTSHHRHEQELQQNVVQNDETPEIEPLKPLPTLDLRDVQLLKTKTKVAVKASDIAIPVPKSVRKRKVRGQDSFYICDLQSVFSLTLPEGITLNQPMKRTKSRATRRKPRL